MVQQRPTDNRDQAIKQPDRTRQKKKLNNNNRIDQDMAEMRYENDNEEEDDDDSKEQGKPLLDQNNQSEKVNKKKVIKKKTNALISNNHGDKNGKKQLKQQNSKDLSSSNPSTGNELQQLINFHQPELTDESKGDQSSEDDSSIQIKLGNGSRLQQYQRIDHDHTDQDILTPYAKATKPQNDQSQRYENSERPQQKSNSKTFVTPSAHPSQIQNSVEMSQRAKQNSKKKIKVQKDTSVPKQKRSDVDIERDLDITNIEVPAKFQKDEFDQPNKKSRNKQGKLGGKDEDTQNNDGPSEEQNIASNKSGSINQNKSQKKGKNKKKQTEMLEVESSQHIEQEMFMPVEESLEHLIGESGEKNKIEKNNTRKGSKSSRITAVNGSSEQPQQPSKNQESQPIEISFTQQLQNGNQDESDQILISKDILQNNEGKRSSDKKKKQKKPGIGQKIKSFMKGDSKQKNNKEYESQIFRDKQQKQSERDQSISEKETNSAALLLSNKQKSTSTQRDDYQKMRGNNSDNNKSVGGNISRRSYITKQERGGSQNKTKTPILIKEKSLGENNEIYDSLEEEIQPIEPDVLNQRGEDLIKKNRIQEPKQKNGNDASQKDGSQNSEQKKIEKDEKKEKEEEAAAKKEAKSSSSSAAESEKSSEEIDPDSMDKDEYFRMLKKKQRKNFILSLRKDANEKNNHLLKIKRIEENPRNVMEIEDKVEDEDEIEFTQNEKFKQVASAFLQKHGFKKLQRWFFGIQHIEPILNESDLGFKARQDEYKRNLKRQIQEKSDSEKLLKKGILKLNNPLRVRWDVFIILFTIYNCIELPIEVGFQWRRTYDKGDVSSGLNALIDSLFGIDIILNFFTTFFHPTTGEEISDKKQIAINYLKGMFFLDVMSTVPFDSIAGLYFTEDNEEDAQHLQIISMLKTIRVFRLSKLIAFLNATDEIKLHLQLVKTIFLIILYIHILACVWYGFGEQITDSEWIPGQTMKIGKPNFFKDYDLPYRFFVSFYTSVLALNGNDIYPVQVPLQYIVGSVYLLMGALMQAYMFGNLAVMVQQLNRKSQSFQEKLDLANTSMRNMLLKEDIQQEIRDFMTRTQSNLDNQKELNQFLMIISPTLRCQVTQHIFETAIVQNPIFQQQNEVMEFLINKITPRLKLPEDILCQQNDSHDKFLCFIARGKCEVSVSNNMRKNVKQRDIQPGDYFGEICLIYDCPRTATVQSLDYSIFAELTQEQFHDLWNFYPNFYSKLKMSIFKTFSDEWIDFKVKLLKQVHYFNKRLAMQDEKFFFEIQFFMQERVYQRGNFIHEAGNKASDLIFVVNGQLDVCCHDQYGDYHNLEQLLQGSHVHQYAIHSQLPTFTTIKAGSAVRLLTLSRKFFECYGLESELSKNFIIEGLEEACHRATKDADKLRKFCTSEEMKRYSLPQCDFRLYERMVLKDPKRINARYLNRAGNRAKTLNKINRKDDNMKMKGLLNDYKKKQLNDNTPEETIVQVNSVEIYRTNQIQQRESQQIKSDSGQSKDHNAQRGSMMQGQAQGNNLQFGQSIQRSSTIFPGRTSDKQKNIMETNKQQNQRQSINTVGGNPMKLMNSKTDSRKAQYMANVAAVKQRIQERQKIAEEKKKKKSEPIVGTSLI